MAIKYGWMEIMELSQFVNTLYELKVISDNQNAIAVIPTVLVPLTALTVLLSSIASIIAGWFGLKLKTEGPKRLLEVLLKKRVLLSMLVLNIVFYGLYFAWGQFKTYPRLLSTIEKNHIPEVSSLSYSNEATRKANYVTENVASPATLSLNLETNYKLSAGSFRSPVISGHSLFLANTIGEILEIDPASMKEKRKFYIGTFIATRPVIYKNFLYSGEGSHDTHHARIYGFDLSTGKLHATYSTKGHNEGTPVATTHKGKDYLVVVGGKDGVHTLSLPDLKLIWKSNEGHIDSSVNIENEYIYAGTGNEKERARSDKKYAVKYELETGNKIWKTELPLSSWMQPILTESEMVCYVLGEIYFPSELGFLYCLDKKTGEPKLSIPTTSPLVGKPTLAKINGVEYIYSADLTGKLIAFNLSTQKIQFMLKPKDVSDYSLSSPTFDPKRNLIFYQSPENGLYVIDALTGKVLFNENIKTASYASPTILEDDVYTIDMSGTLKHFKINPSAN